MTVCLSTSISLEVHIQSSPVFYCVMLCIRSTSHGPVSLRPSQVGVLLKRLNVGSHKQHHTIDRDSSFLKPKISAKFDRGHPRHRCQMRVGWFKIGDFRQITGYISKTVQDRCMVSIKSQIGSRMRSIDWWHCPWLRVPPNHPEPPHFLHFAPTFIAL